MTLRAMLFIMGWAAADALAAPVLPRPQHIVIVIEENKQFAQVIGNPAAPYINQLASRGVLFTASYGITHPSQPNYLALFSGSTHGVSSDTCPWQASGSNLAQELLAQGRSFISYAESLPHTGFEGCSDGPYYRKHNPLANWKELKQFNQAFKDFPLDFENLPTVALLIPDQQNDMHDGSIAQADAWLSDNVESYAKWAMMHDSLLIVTWDEDDGSAGNRIATIFVGPMVNHGISGEHINHYSILRTLEEMYDLPYLGESALVKPIVGVWMENGLKRR